MEDDRNRCRSAASEQMVSMAENQPLAMTASSLLSDAIAELHGVPGQKERRKELRHRLIDVQAGILDEMSSSWHPLDLTETVEQTREKFSRASLHDKLFLFAALEASPHPKQLADEAAETIRNYPLSSLFGSSSVCST